LAVVLDESAVDLSLPGGWHPFFSRIDMCFRIVPMTSMGGEATLFQLKDGMGQADPICSFLFNLVV
jgi:hypothetical protein